MSAKQKHPLPLDIDATASNLTGERDSRGGIGVGSHEVSKNAVRASNEEYANPAGYNETVVHQNRSIPESVLDLPAEVKANLVGYEDMALDEMICRILATYSVGTTCDRLIQHLWMQYRQNPLRAKVMSRLRQLIKIGDVEKMDGMRSMYRLAHPQPAFTTASGPAHAQVNMVKGGE